MRLRSTQMLSSDRNCGLRRSNHEDGRGVLAFVQMEEAARPWRPLARGFSSLTVGREGLGPRALASSNGLVLSGWGMDSLMGIGGMVGGDGLLGGVARSLPPSRRRGISGKISSSSSCCCWTRQRRSRLRRLCPPGTSGVWLSPWSGQKPRSDCRRRVFFLVVRGERGFEILELGGQSSRGEKPAFADRGRRLLLEAEVATVGVVVATTRMSTMGAATATA